MQIDNLYCYPIKSCRGHAPIAGVIERRGFEHDRRFMVVDDAGLFRSQRNDPALARIGVAVTDERLELTAADVGSACIDWTDASDGARIDISVWRHCGTAIDQGDAVAQFLSEVVGARCRLVYMADDNLRAVNPQYAVSDADIIGFADGYPFLLTSTSSLAELQLHMDEPVPMERFRPNIVIDGAQPWAEDDWSELLIGTARFAVAKPCTRCAITTTDQCSGARSREPLRTLGSRRRTPDGVTFGMYLIPLDVGATIAPGDTVQVIR